MTYEERCIAHYWKVQGRVGKYPMKRPVVIPATTGKRRKPVPKRSTGPAPKHTYDAETIFKLFQQGLTQAAIGLHVGIPQKAISRFIRKMKWERAR